MEVRYEFKAYRENIFFYNVNNVTATTNPHDDFKIHISLDWKAYREHYEPLRQIIVGYLELGVIDVFKYVKPDLAGDHYSKWLAGEVDHFHPITGKLIYCELNPSQERFIYSDQFTIYIPQRHRKEGLAELCLNINNYIQTNGLIPGEKSDVAVNITPWINMRLEYLQNGEQTVRIDAMALYDENPKDRHIYPVYVQNNRLFQYLHRQLNPEETCALSPEALTITPSPSILPDTLPSTSPTPQSNSEPGMPKKKKKLAFFSRLFKKKKKEKKAMPDQNNQDIFNSNQPR